MFDPKCYLCWSGLGSEEYTNKLPNRGVRRDVTCERHLSTTLTISYDGMKEWYVPNPKSPGGWLEHRLDGPSTIYPGGAPDDINKEWRVMGDKVQ